MSHVLRILLYRIWITLLLTIFFTFIIFWFYGILLASIVVTTGIVNLLYNAQDLLLYNPNQPSESRVFVSQPSSYNLPFENIKVKTKDGLKIHMFLILQATDSKHKPTMIFFHGNAGNMGHRISNAHGFYHNLNVNILLVEYRGYGLSEGWPSEQGLYIDAQTSLEYILDRDDIDHTKIIVFGRSLGGAVALDLASQPLYRDHIWAVIVENTFTSIPDMSYIVLKFRCLSWLPLFCHKNKFSSLSKMMSVRCPTMVVCGSQDTLVPMSMGQKLVANSGAALSRLSVLRGGHDDTWTSDDYYQEIGRFLALVPPLKPTRPLRQQTRCLHTV